MTTIVSSSTERLIVHARVVAAKETLNVASSRFPSHLRVFGNFFELHAAKLPWGAAQYFPVCCPRFPIATPSMAFV
jgi:hypothetical protein